MRNRWVFLFGAATSLAVALVALTMVSLSGQRNTHAVMMQKLFDVDGPSARDPSKAAWAKAGQGSAHWMENKHAPTVLSQKAHSRGREDRIFDSLIRNAPREVSEVLHIPMAHVQKLEQKVAKDMVHRFNQEKKAQQMHSVHRGMLKGQGGMMLDDEEDAEKAMINLGSINITDMTGCEGKYKGCDVLAENILEVAKSISQNCATLYFDEKAYYKCEAQYAEPVCRQVDRDFPKMCGIGGATKEYTADHGYFGGKEHRPANIEGAFCNGCTQIERANGCFAAGTLVEVRGAQALLPLAQVTVGSWVRSADTLTKQPTWARVLLTHTHTDTAATVAIEYARGEGMGGSVTGSVSLTGTHPLRVASGELRRAADIKVGDELVAVGGSVEVTQVSLRSDKVTYVLTDNDSLLIHALIAPTQSTMAGELELLPFHFLDRLQLLQHAATQAALASVLESPFLVWAEQVLDAALALVTTHSNSCSSKYSTRHTGVSLLRSALPQLLTY